MERSGKHRPSTYTETESVYFWNRSVSDEGVSPCAYLGQSLQKRELRNAAWLDLLHVELELNNRTVSIRVEGKRAYFFPSSRVWAPGNYGFLLCDFGGFEMEYCRQRHVYCALGRASLYANTRCMYQHMQTNTNKQKRTYKNKHVINRVKPNKRFYNSYFENTDEILMYALFSSHESCTLLQTQTLFFEKQSRFKNYYGDIYY